MSAYFCQYRQIWCMLYTSRLLLRAQTRHSNGPHHSSPGHKHTHPALLKRHFVASTCKGHRTLHPTEVQRYNNCAKCNGLPPSTLIISI